MVIFIPNDAELYALQVALECENKPISTLLKKIQTHYANEATIEIQIDPVLLSDGYRANASMLARNSSLGTYSYTRGLYRDSMVVVLYTNNSDEGVRFWKRLKDFLHQSDHTQTFEIEIDDVPETYRHKPELLRYRFRRDEHIEVITRKTKTHWIYRRAKT